MAKNELRQRKRPRKYNKSNSEERVSKVFSDSKENEDEIRCEFIPFSILEKLEKLNGDKLTSHNNVTTSCCKNIAVVKKINSIHNVTHNHSWKVIYTHALKQAVYSHNWDELLYLLKACPIWEHYDTSRNSNLFIDNYYRALIILLMYHPTAQGEDLMKEFLVMALSFRSEEEQRAFVKALVCLPEKLISRVKNITQHEIVMQYK